MTLRKKLIRLAWENPDLRPDLLPILKEGVGGQVFEGKLEYYSKSLNSLIKYNNGFWKSDKQARFLWKKLQDFRDKQAKQWARTVPGYQPRKHLVIEESQKLPYGHRDPTKIRISTQYFIIDGGGVLARATVKNHHPTKADPEFYVMPETAKTTFTRPKGAKPPIWVDFAGEARKKEQERQKQIKKNQKTIALIKKIPKWDEQDIFEDFIGQLNRGWTLSSGQMAVVERNLPPEALSGTAPDDPKAWAQMQADVDKFVGKLIMAWGLWREKDLSADAKKFPKSEMARKLKTHPQDIKDAVRGYLNNEGLDFGLRLTLQDLIGEDLIRLKVRGIWDWGDLRPCVLLTIKGGKKKLNAKRLGCLRALAYMHKKLKPHLRKSVKTLEKEIYS